jgi:putative flippase GtrA
MNAERHGEPEPRPHLMPAGTDLNPGAPRSSAARRLFAYASSKPSHRYVVIGGCVYVFEILMIVLAQHLGASAVVAVGVSFWLGLMVSFVLQKLVTFSDKRMHHRVLLPQIVAFSALVLFNFGFTLLLTKLLEHVLPAVVTRTLAVGVTTLWNFYLYKTRIFIAADEPIVY